MNDSIKSILYASSILLVLAVCVMTGLSQSPFRFAFFPLIVLLAPRIRRNILVNAGFTFSMLFVMMLLFETPPHSSLPDLLAEALSFFLVTVAVGFISRDLQGERQRAENAVATYRALSDDLNLRTSILQSTLDTLSKVNRQLQKADQDKNRFIANVSHELRTPLTSIRSYSEILITYNDIDDETRKEFIRTINAESERMTLMVNENLDLLRIETGKFEMNIGQIRCAALLEKSCKVVAPMALEKGVPLVLDIPSEVPIVRGDENQLNQVLVNLLNNAVKYTEKGKITAGVRLKEQCAEFFVADTGEGIFPEEKEVIFDEYYRIAEEVRDRPRGSGLGLSISKKIVELHGGRIWVDSTPGKGSTFYFTVPLTAEVESAAAPTEIAETADIVRHGPILIIYEGIAVRQSLRKKLESLGFNTIGADTPKRGLELAVAIRPGLIVSDFVGGGEDFAKLAEWAHRAGIEMMLATLCVNPANRDLCLPASGYLPKSSDRHQIVPFIERALKIKGHIFIVSPEKDEARNLQVMLSAAGYGTSLYMNEDEALRAAAGTVANGIIIGSFAKSRLEGVLTAVMGAARLRALPCYLLLEEDCFRHVTMVTIDAASRQKVGGGVSLLITAIEKFYARK